MGKTAREAPRAPLVHTAGSLALIDCFRARVNQQHIKRHCHGPAWCLLAPAHYDKRACWEVGHLTRVVGRTPLACPITTVQVDGIPTFVVVDGETEETITLEGRGKVGGDAACKDFPWRSGASSGGGNEAAAAGASDDDDDYDDDDDDDDDDE